MKPLFGSVSLFFVLLLYTCNPLDPVATQIQNAINQLTQQSQQWQATLTQLENTLIAEGQSTIANEVTQLVQRGIATAGTELRCDADFVGNRMIEGLQRILAEIQHKPIPPLKQYFCQAVPDHIDLSLDPSRRSELDFYGYNLDAGTVTVTLLDDTGQHAVPANLIASPTHYLMTVNISSNGVQFSATAHQLVFTFQTGGGQSVNVETCGDIGQACCGFQRACHVGGCSSNNVCGTFSISQATFTDHFAGGGNGGNPFPTPPQDAEECPAGSVSVGMQGKSGDRIDNVELLCANLGQDGSLGPSFGLTAHGGSGGSDFANSEICPNGQIFIGMYGVYGDSVDHLGGECNSPASVLVNGPGTRLLSNGGSGGNTPFDVTCNPGSVITGFMGRSGSEVDQIRFRCRPLVFKTQ